jgi:hypothetical protein
MKKLLTNKKLMSCLSVFLVFALILTNLSLGGVKAKADGPTTSNGSSELVGYRKVSEPDAEFDNGADAVVTSADGAVAISKTVTKVDGTVSDYDVKLKVTTTENTENAKDIAVAIVVDLSNSMKWSLGNTTRVKAASDNIQALLTSLRGSTDGKCYISLIGFGSNARKLTDWLDINGTAQQEITHETCGGCGGSSTETVTTTAYEFLMNEVSEDNLNALISNLGGGTNMQGGLMLAKNRLAMSDLSGINSNCKFTVLVSDGEPTFHVNSDNTNTDSISGTQGGGQYCNNYDYNGAINAATALKNAGNKIFSIFIGTENDTFDKNDDRNQRVRISDFLGAISSLDAEGNAGIYYGNNVASLSEAFKKASAAIIAASRANGWQVTDPIGPKFTVTSEISGDDVAFENNVITWSLSKDNCVEDKTTPGLVKFIYEYTYRVKLDLTQEGFEDNVPYPVNGQTILHMLNNETMEFKVPFIKGVAPTFAYTVEYYKENLNTNPKTYTEVTTDKVSGIARVNAVVAAPEGYATKYAADHFAFDNGATSITISATGNNVLKLYYSKEQFNVTVNKKYTTVTYSANGEQSSSSANATPTAVKVYYGGSYSVDNYNQDQTVGDLVFTYKSGAGSVTNVTTDSAINLVYERIEDGRQYPIKVTYHYTNNNYVVNETTGKFELVTTTGDDIEAVNTAQTGNSVYRYTIDSNKTAGYAVKEIKINGTAASAANGVIETTLTCAANNTIDIYCESDAGNLPDTVPVLVERVYEYDEVVLDDDLKGVHTVHHIATDPAVNAQMVPEEWIMVTDATTYGGKTYTADPSNAEKLGKKTVPNGGLHIVLHYTAETIDINKVTVTINHSYFTRTAETVLVYDGEVVTGSTVEYRVTQDGNTVVDTRENRYVGTKEENIYNKGVYTVSDSSIDVNAEYIIVPEGGLVININYIKDATEDNRDKTSVKVEHKYYRDVKYVEAGVEKHDEKQFVGSDEVNVSELVVGDTYTATEALTYDGKTYERQTDNLSIVLQPGSNIITIEYLLSDVDEREPAPVSAIYRFEKYTMTVNDDGVAGYYDDPEIATAAAVEAGTFGHYVGMDVTFAAGNVEEFADYELEGTANYTKRLGSSGNDYTFVYKLYVELDKATILVSHAYKLTTIAENGDESVTKSTVPGTPFEKYVGEKFTVTPVRNGYDLVNVSDTAALRRLRGGMPVYDADYIYTGTAFATGNNVVLSYERTDDNSVKADYKITNVYITRDWDESETQFSEVVTGSAFKTNVITVSPSALEGYEFTNMTTNPEGIATDGAVGTYLITLVATGEGEFNEITFYHVQEIDSREYANIIVKHNYFKYDTYTKSGNEAEGSYEETFNGEADKIWWIGSNFEFDSATMANTTFNERTYTYKSVSPASIVVDVENNVVEVTYVREYSSYVYVPPYNPPADNPPADNPPADNPPADNPPTVNPTTIDDEPGMDLGDDEQALGDAVFDDDDDGMDLDDDDQALGDALVKTGTVPVTVFYGFGAILMLAALLLVFKRRKMV